MACAIHGPEDRSQEIVEIGAQRVDEQHRQCDRPADRDGNLRRLRCGHKLISVGSYRLIVHPAMQPDVDIKPKQRKVILALDQFDDGAHDGPLQSVRDVPRYHLNNAFSRASRLAASRPW